MDMAKDAQPKNTQRSITLQAQHSTALAELENYKLLVESIEDYAIFLLDPDGYIVSWNKGAERNKGYTSTEIIGQHFSKFYLQHDIDADKPGQELEIAKKYGRIEDEDWRVRKDGSRFWANVIITALYDKSGRLVGFAKVTRDLTDRKRHEDELRKANTTLRKQGEDLKLLNASKDEFISLASHQLRTPVTAIKQLLGLLLEGFQGEVPADHLAIIKKANASNERQLTIVNSLLQVAQLDAGKVILRKAPVNINELVNDVINEQSDTIKDRKQTIRSNTSTKVITAEIDSKYFRMALENLIDNASKYTPDGGNIIINSSIVTKRLNITIQDTGVGIASEDMGRLFEKFTRIQNELSQKVSGSGLGLYWVREVIRLHEGIIDIESTPGVGTTFIISLAQGDIHA
jgi:PAS domain S-box-containing protein